MCFDILNRRPVARAADDAHAHDGRASGAHGERGRGVDGAFLGHAWRIGASSCHGARRATASSKTAANSPPPPSQALGGIALRHSTRSASHTSAHDASPRAGTSPRARVPTPFPLVITGRTSVSDAIATSRAWYHPNLHLLRFVSPPYITSLHLNQCCCRKFTKSSL
ncbi:unnamed protein product [Leptosia nina]|uniref:Uncharacterized protein n=1 Tax=Leptosia nina TaxID=320188 RepID=A0AAV1J451_9NEOP